MRWPSKLAYLASCLGSAQQVLAANTVVVQDAQTGFTFSQYSAQYALGKYIQIGIAIPSPADSSFDLVVQISAPSNVGWTGIAWAGTMIYSPLTVGWANGDSVADSVFHSPTHTMPTRWDGATLTPLRVGTQVNSTGWQLTALCSGCSNFLNSNNESTMLNPSGTNRLAFAECATNPNGDSSSGTLTVHDVYGYWDHDFSTAGNTNFDELVAQNS